MKRINIALIAVLVAVLLCAMIAFIAKVESKDVMPTPTPTPIENAIYPPVETNNQIVIKANIIGEAEKQDELIVEIKPETQNKLNVKTAIQYDDPIVYKEKWTHDEAEMIAKTVWGEARGCSDIQKQAVVWCILNRVDNEKFPDTIEGVITSPNQFHGYGAGNPVDDDILELVIEVLHYWNDEDDEHRILPKEYLYFSGNGIENTFTTAYCGGERWYFVDNKETMDGEE